MKIKIYADNIKIQCVYDCNCDCEYKKEMLKNSVCVGFECSTLLYFLFCYLLAVAFSGQQNSKPVASTSD